MKFFGNSWVTPGLAAFTLAACVLLLYWPATGFEYIGLDDIQYVGTNRAVNQGITPYSFGRAFTDVRVGYWTPILWISYMIDAEVYPHLPAGFHFTNILLQALVSGMLVLLLLEMTGALWPSLLTAALFSFHPLRVETVAWIAGRKDLLSMVFSLPAIHFYVRYARSGRLRHYISMIVLFILGMAVKPAFLTLPVLLLALDVWPLGRAPLWDAPPRSEQPKKPWKTLFLEKIPFLAVSTAFAISVTLLQGEGLYRVGGELTSWARLKMAATSYMIHLKKTFWPVDLPLLEFFLTGRVPSAWAAISSFLALCALTWLALRQVRSRPYLTVGWLWFALALLPVCGLAPAGMQWIADRFTYVPHLMFLAGLSWWAMETADRLPCGRWALAASSLVVIAVLTALSLGQLLYWQNGVTLFSKALEKDPQNYLSRLQLGIALGPAGRLSEAEEQFLKVIEQRPFFMRGHFFLGMTYLDQGRYEEAARKFSEVLTNEGDYYPAQYMMGKALTKLGDYAAAERHLREYLRLEPGSDMEVSTLDLLGVVKASSGEMDDAMAFFSNALDLEPLFPQAHYNLALALSAQGRMEEAEPHFVAALEGSLKLKTAYIKLAEDVETEGKPEEAAVHIRRYLKLFPDDPKAAQLLERLGILSLKLGDRQGAIPWFLQALEKDPDNLLFKLNLAENLYLASSTYQAAPYFEQIAAQDPGTAEGAFARGRLLLMEGKISEAEAAFRTGLLSPALLASTPAALRRSLANLNLPNTYPRNPDSRMGKP